MHSSIYEIKGERIAGSKNFEFDRVNTIINVEILSRKVSNFKLSKDKKYAAATVVSKVKLVERKRPGS